VRRQAAATPRRGSRSGFQAEHRGSRERVPDGPVEGETVSDENASTQEIEFAPTDGLTYNPNEKVYWDRGALQKEIDRTFELCHSCRMCFKFCQSFPTLFEAVDRLGGVRAIPEATTDRIVDECFQCKLCYTNCPYTEAEGHAFKLDFPRLMLRANAIRRRRHGIPLRERLLADPDRLGKLGTLVPALANWANAFRPNRILMEKVAGIHRDKLLPRFERPTFPAWFRERNGGMEGPAGGSRAVVLFSTCFVNWNRPAVGKAAFEVLSHNGCSVACPEVNCCGMPALDGGDVEFARRQAARNVDALLPYVERGYTIAVINPTCSLMMRQEYTELLRGADGGKRDESSRKVAAAVRDVSEFLYELRQAGEFKEDFLSTPGGPVAYHAPCHLRMQNIGFRGRDLMRRIPGVQPKLVAECCGHDGTWAMKREFFDLSLVNGRKAFEGMNETGAEVWTTDCPLAAVQFEQACGKKALHPLEVLARAYREDGFPERVKPGSPEAGS
jgi:Fe-S oxidoreductase